MRPSTAFGRFFASFFFIAAGGVTGLRGRAWPRFLQNYFKCLLIQSRGTDESNDKVPYSIKQCACDVLHVLDYFGLPSTSFVDCSAGGAVGFFLAANHANRLDALVLVSPTPAVSFQYHSLLDTADSWAACGGDSSGDDDNDSSEEQNDEAPELARWLQWCAARGTTGIFSKVLQR